MLPSLRKRIRALLWLAWLTGLFLGITLGAAGMSLSPTPRIWLPVALSGGLVSFMVLVFVLVGWVLDKDELSD